MGPITFYISFESNNSFDIFGIVIPNAVGAWLWRLLAIILLVAGVGMVITAVLLEKTKQRITFAATSFIFPDAGVGGGTVRTIDYKFITNISSSGTNDRKYIHLTAPGGKVTFGSRDMESIMSLNPITQNKIR